MSWDLGGCLGLLLTIWLLLVSVFNSFVSTGVSLEMATVVVKEESDDPDYYQYAIPGNDTNFHVCLSHERVNCLSVVLSLCLSFCLFWSLNMPLLGSVRLHFHAGYHLSYSEEYQKSSSATSAYTYVCVCGLEGKFMGSFELLGVFSEDRVCRL